MPSIRSLAQAMVWRRRRRALSCTWSDLGGAMAVTTCRTLLRAIAAEDGRPQVQTWSGGGMVRRMRQRIPEAGAARIVVGLWR